MTVEKETLTYTDKNGQLEKKGTERHNGSRTFDRAHSAKQVQMAMTGSGSKATKKMLSQSNLTPVLSEYGLQLSETKAKSLQKNQSPGAKPKSRESMKREDSFSKAEEERKQHYLQVYRDMQRGKQLCYDEYLEKMRDKVDLQRELIRRKTQQTEDRIKAQKEREREESHRVRKRLQRVELSHDDGFLAKLPKSDHYKILVVQKRLEQEGLIRTRADRELFLENIHQPGMLDFHYRKYSQTASHHGSQMSLTDRDSCAVSQPSMELHSQISSSSSLTASGPQDKETKGQPTDFRPMTGIEEVGEHSRPTTRHDSTVAEQRSRPTSKVSPRSKRKLDPQVIAKQAAVELDRRCPQQEMPELYCLTVDLGKKPPDSEEVLQEMEARRRDRERQLFVKRLRRMYQLSQTHRASTQRILDKHEEQGLFLEGPPLNEVLAVDRLLSPEPDTTQHSQVSSSSQSRPWVRHLGLRRQISPITEESESAFTGRSELDTNGSRVEQFSAAGLERSSARHTVAEEQTSTNPPAALSLEGVKEHSKILEPKCLSTLWTNYLGVGRSAFAPT